MIYIISLLMFANQCLGRSPGEGKGYPLQYLGLENSMDCVVHRLQSQTPLSYFHFVSVYQSEAPTLPQGMEWGMGNGTLTFLIITFLKQGPRSCRKTFLHCRIFMSILKRSEKELTIEIFYSKCSKKRDVRHL